MTRSCRRKTVARIQALQPPRLPRLLRRPWRLAWRCSTTVRPRPAPRPRPARPARATKRATERVPAPSGPTGNLAAGPVTGLRPIVFPGGARKAVMRIMTPPARLSREPVLILSQMLHDCEAHDRADPLARLQDAPVLPDQEQVDELEVRRDAA